MEILQRIVVKPMLPLVEFCESNINQGNQSTVEALTARDDVEVMTYGCMSECSICAQVLFCMFEGERISASTPEALLTKIEQAISEWHAEFL